MDSVAEVGSLSAGDGLYGHPDLVGNMWKWTIDRYTSSFAKSTCQDRAVLSGGGPRTVAGGNFAPTLSNATGSMRNGFFANRGSAIGFRYARPPTSP